MKYYRLLDPIPPAMRVEKKTTIGVNAAMQRPRQRIKKKKNNATGKETKLPLCLYGSGLSR